MIINYVISFILLSLIQADQLLSVHIIWRHGARKPYFCNWNCTAELKAQMSALTPTGMRQQYVLGQWIRKKYIDTGFLSSIFDENEIYIESSDTNRTIMSAYANLMGMYPEGLNVPDVANGFLLPPNKGAVTPVGIDNFALPNHIALIPIHSLQQQLDYYMYMYCPSLWDDGKHNENTDVFFDINGRSKELISRFNKELNQNVTNIVQLYQWRDTFTANIYNGEPNPTELTASLMSELNKIAGLGFLLEYTQDYYQAQLLSSEFFRIVLEGFDGILNSTSKIKYHAYSAHDSSIYALLYALNLTNVECYNQTYFEGKSNQSTCITTYPDFTANIIFELYNNAITGPYVKLMYNGTYMNICHESSQTCTYSRFKSIIKGIMLDYKKECQIEDTNTISIEKKTPGWAIALFVITAILCLIIIFGVVYLKKQKQNDVKSLSE